MDSLESIRANIDRVDETLVQLIEQRAELVQLLISVKAKQGLTARIPEREEAILDALHQRHGKHFSKEELESIYRPIFDACVRLQLE
ncbi:chorismate mutase [Kangiella marina]|uniref:chorismate mutase n=1 Tax=Kangiella marina TaxID=1079178 RepID=A0ABP8IA24_9GAMM